MFQLKDQIMSIQQTPIITEQSRPVSSHPHLIFFTRLDPAALRSLLVDDRLLDELVAQGHGIALAVTHLDDDLAAVVRHLNTSKVYTVAWLLLPVEYGCWLNAQNYPQALEHYRAFRMWVHSNHLSFDAIGLDIKPPIHDIIRLQQRKWRDIAWQLSHDDVLHPAASTAYHQLVAEIRRDKYQVHTYQLPLLADDRRAGTTLLQRSLDIVDMPSDVEVFMCFSSAWLAGLPPDLGGALIASYRPAADSIAVGSTGTGSVQDGIGETMPPLSWPALERDLLLAARYTDTIYIFSLEGCSDAGLLPRIAAMDWTSEAYPLLQRTIPVTLVRFVLFVTLMLARFHRSLLAWSGWVVAVLLLLQRRRRTRKE
jgi:hypothetical protein